MSIAYWLPGHSQRKSWNKILKSPEHEELLFHINREIADLKKKTGLTVSTFHVDTSEEIEVTEQEMIIVGTFEEDSISQAELKELINDFFTIFICLRPPQKQKTSVPTEQQPDLL